ncbi:hypothetical protein LINGRAHAP2_LOCUS22386 [Linum grandiflorum]
MQLEEVKAAVAALWNTRGLSWPPASQQHRQKAGDLDLLDWLRAMFGFKRDIVWNQREHLILLLANNHIRLNTKPGPLNKARTDSFFLILHPYAGCFMKLNNSKILTICSYYITYYLIFFLIAIKTVLIISANMYLTATKACYSKFVPDAS